MVYQRLFHPRAAPARYGPDTSLSVDQPSLHMHTHTRCDNTVDFFIRRYIRVLNTVTAVKGWVGWATDLFHALFVRRDPAKSSRVG